MSPRYSAIVFAAALMLAPVLANAAALDTPTVSVVARGHGKVVMDVTAGPSGAPNGFAMYWMTQFDYEDYGSVWPDLLSYPTLKWALFTGAPTLNTFDGQYNSFVLGPNQTIRVELGDLNGETGVNTNTIEELTPGESYVICAYAIGGAGSTRSFYSENGEGTLTLQGSNCTYTVGWWKTHGDDWNYSLMLGNVLYSKAQLLQILNQPVQGNGLISMAHQLIAAKLNIASGADGSSIAATIAAADAQIGNLVVPPIGGGSLPPGQTSGKTQLMDDYNQGITGPGHCPSTPTHSSTWGRVKQLYR